ncbi:hypothetical protein [Stenotrophomonas maltophilia]|uniref:hypothetical protein n=1 Tax=Stenotrophomonas maltophilia TaxID=40324 RepID=UPI0015F3ACF9|nr:hypothetical protein [Stenotrophomonas maltophilia]
MNLPPPGRWLALAIALASSTACSKAPSKEPEHRETPMTDIAQSHTVDGYTYTTAPVEATLGPHRYAFPANLYDDQMGPTVGGGIGLTLLWPDLQAAPPGTRASRSMSDHHRAISLSLDYIDALPIAELLPRKTSTEATTEDGSINRDDPRRRLDLRNAGTPHFGLTPYAIDEARMTRFSEAYAAQRGTPPVRTPETDQEWYIARDTQGALATFITCNPPQDGREGLTVQGTTLVDDPDVPVATCTHTFTDPQDGLSVRAIYPRVLLKDWKAVEDATRVLLARYKLR